MMVAMTAVVMANNIHGADRCDDMVKLRTRMIMTIMTRAERW